MRINNIIKTCVLSGLVSVGASSCKKVPLRPMPVQKQEIVSKLDSLMKEGTKISKDTSYCFFGKDTLELTDKFVKNTSEFVNDINKKAAKKTPKFEIGKTLKTEMIPKSGGGFDMIPVMKPEYVPQYMNQKAIITSTEVFTRDGNDMFVPVEYYGTHNPKAVKKKK